MIREYKEVSKEALPIIEKTFYKICLYRKKYNLEDCYDFIVDLTEKDYNKITGFEDGNFGGFNVKFNKAKRFRINYIDATKKS